MFIYLVLLLLYSLPSSSQTETDGPCGCLITAGSDGVLLAVDVPTGVVHHLYTTNIVFSTLSREEDDGQILWTYSNGTLYRIDICNDQENLITTVELSENPAFAFTETAFNAEEAILYLIDPGQNVGRVDVRTGEYASLPGSSSAGISPSNIQAALYYSGTRVIYEGSDNLLFLQSTLNWDYSYRSFIPASAMDFVRCQGTTVTEELVVMTSGDLSVTKYNIEASKSANYFTIIYQQPLYVEGLVSYPFPCCQLCNSPTWMACAPTSSPTLSPTKHPTTPPTKRPTTSPTKRPTNSPIKGLTDNPTIDSPTATNLITSNPTTNSPITNNPTTNNPTTKSPTNNPIMSPFNSPTKSPVAMVPSTITTGNPLGASSYSPTTDTTTTNDMITTNLQERNSKEQNTENFLEQTGIGLWIGIGAAITIILCLILYLLRRRRQKVKSEENAIQITYAARKEGDIQSDHITLWEEHENVESTEPNVVRKQQTVASYSTTPHGPDPTSFPDVDPDTQRVIQAMVVLQNSTQGGSTIESPSTFATKELTRKDTNQSEADKEGIQEEGHPEKNIVPPIANDQKLYDFLKELQLSQYYDTIHNSGWNMDSLLNIYNGTTQSLQEAKVMFSQNWNMSLPDRLRLEAALKYKYAEQLNKDDGQNTITKGEETAAGNTTV